MPKPKASTDPVVHDACLYHWDNDDDGKRTKREEQVQLHEVTHLYAGLNPEDEVYRSAKGCTIKLKMVDPGGRPGFSHVLISPAIVDGKTGKALDHPRGPGGKFICEDHQVNVMSDQVVDFDRALLNGKARAIFHAENAWDHHQKVKAVAAPHDPARHPLIQLRGVARYAPAPKALEVKVTPPEGAPSFAPPKPKALPAPAKSA